MDGIDINRATEPKNTGSSSTLTPNTASPTKGVVDDAFYAHYDAVARLEKRGAEYLMAGTPDGDILPSDELIRHAQQINSNPPMAMFIMIYRHRCPESIAGAEVFASAARKFEMMERRMQQAANEPVLRRRIAFCALHETELPDSIAQTVTTFPTYVVYDPYDQVYGKFNVPSAKLEGELEAMRDYLFRD
ncbi:MAG: hypothetical protein WC763_05820 [Candidatus Paceibacterota bacterium]